MAEGSDTNYWTLVTILGPLILLGLIVWAISRNKKDKVDRDTTERGTRQVYEEEQRIHENDKSSGL
jgi:hypothetical protein